MFPVAASPSGSVMRKRKIKSLTPEKHQISDIESAVKPIKQSLEETNKRLAVVQYKLDNAVGEINKMSNSVKSQLFMAVAILVALQAAFLLFFK